MVCSMKRHQVYLPEINILLRRISMRDSLRVIGKRLAKRLRMSPTCRGDTRHVITKVQKNTHGVPNLNLSTVSKYQTEEEVQRESRRTYLEQLASLQWKSSNIALNSRRKWHNNGPEGEMRLVSPRPGAIPRFSLTKSPRKKGGSPGSNNASPGDGSGFPNITGTGNGPEVASPSSPSGGTDEAFHVTQATMPPNTHAYTANGASTVMRQPNTTLSVGASQQLDVNELERVGQPELAPVIISPKKI
eukprot:gb/GECG01014632.1/.p1 GENE.gb/GECG01014632.1/~~gb/GECG01014632.1/.p1  ORF type:complete len:246 (+),score=24.57 gb/GECG01014632.1/:1-738(+)